MPALCGLSPAFSLAELHVMKYDCNCEVKKSGNMDIRLATNYGKVTRCTTTLHRPDVVLIIGKTLTQHSASYCVITEKEVEQYGKENNTHRINQ
jgi:hypothetical protein